MGEGAESARERMLDAGAAIWTDEPTAEVLSGLSVTGISKKAGVTRSTFYAHWPTTEDYLIDLVRHLADPVWGSTPIDRTVARSIFASGGVRLIDRLFAACDSHVEALVSDPRFPLRMALLSRLDDPSIAAELRKALDAGERAHGDQVSQLDVLWGRVPRAPFELRHVLMALNAMADGLAVRHRLDPEGFPIRLYGLLALSLLVVTTRHPTDQREVTDLFATINDWPTTPRTPIPRSSPIDGPALSENNVLELVLEARRLAGADGWIEVSLPRLAAQTSTSESRVIRAFGSKAGLGLAIYLLDIHERYRELVPTDDPLADLRTMIDIKSDVLQRSSAITQSIFAVLSGGATYARPHSFSFDPRPMFVEAVRRARDAGSLDASIDPAGFASVLDHTILFSNLPMAATAMRRSDPVELVLRGAGAVPNGA